MINGINNPSIRHIDAEKEVATLSYATQPPATSPLNFQKDTLSIADKKTESTSFFKRAKDWLWNILKIKTEESKNETDEQRAPLSPLDGNTPQLSPPEITERKHVVKAVTDLNRYLKDSSERSEEINSSNIDKLIFLQLVHRALKQKELKEEGGKCGHAEVLQRQKHNKTLQKTYYDSLDIIQKCNKTKNVLKWVDVALTSATMATFAVSFFLSGGLTALGAAAPIAGLLKGGSMGSTGVVKHKSEVETGKIGIVQLDMKTNSDKVGEELTDLGTVNTEIANLHKLIKELLYNQRQAERAIGQ
ncbi:MAG: hypothetical protein WCG42_09455 [Parachlamydiaceae bacterium]